MPNRKTVREEYGKPGMPEQANSIIFYKWDHIHTAASTDYNGINNFF